MSERIIIFIDNYMFDVTEYCTKHPGGKKILLEYKNKDATEAFNNINGHNDEYCLNLLDKYCIGKKPDKFDKFNNFIID